VDKKRLYDAKLSPLLLYDLATRTGWLVPEISVLLHMIKADVTHIRDIPPRTLKMLCSTGCSSHCSGTALVAIEPCNGLEFWKDKDGKPYLFSDAVSAFLDAFEMRKA